MEKNLFSLVIIIQKIVFQSHDQICALFYWSSVDIQIRLKAKIEKTKVEFNGRIF